MKTLLQHALLPLASLSLAAAVCAAPLPFSASYNGSAQVVEVINATGPVLRFETVAAGSGSFDLVSYFSTDVIDMSTGAGTGSSRFVDSHGDALYGSFAVQVIPTATANVVDLLGQATFTGGTGIFSGASGSASLIGSGIFTSATSAIASLTYNGSIALVPEPAAWLLWAGGALALALRRAYCAP